MTAITNRIARDLSSLPSPQPLTSRAAAKPATAKPADVVELAKAREATRDPILDLSAPPTLPSSGQAPALGRDFGERLEVYGSEMDGGAAALAWGALMEMSRSATNDIRIAAEVRSAMQRGAIEAKAGEIGKAERENAHQRASSLMTLAGSVAVQTVAVLACGVSPMIGMGISGIGGALTNATSQNVGPGRQAAKEKLQQMHQDMTRMMFEMNVDSAKASYDEAKEQFKLAQRILGEHAERQTQISTTITRV